MYVHCVVLFLPRLLTKDKEEMETLRQAKLLEEEKAQFSVSSTTVEGRLRWARSHKLSRGSSTLNGMHVIAGVVLKDPSHAH